MKTYYSNQHQHGRAYWLKKPMMSGLYHHWLIDINSLTMRLQQRYANFAVKPVLVEYAKPFLDETSPLAISLRKSALIREVELLGNNHVVVFAHSVLPRKSLRGAWLGLSHLGNKPLGATLFANPQVKRGPLCYKKLSRRHLLYQHATKNLPIKPPYLWARRSVFTLNHANIMVTEVFLPQLLLA